MTLSQLVQQRLDDLGLSMRAACLRSRGHLSYETMRTVAQNRHGRITDRTAEGLALALDVPISHIYEAASQPQPISRWELPRRLDRLPKPQRRLVEDIAESLLATYEKGFSDGQAAAKR